MALVYSTAMVYDSIPNHTTYVPCCNIPVDVDGLYQARHFQEVYYAPEPAPQIEFVRQRLPDPPPDVIDRVLVVPQPKKYIYQVVEVPSKPPPIIQERVVHQPPNAPVCGGTYKVRVPHKVSGQQAQIVQSSSNVSVSPAQSYVQLAPPIVSNGATYVQSSPSFIQTEPFVYASPSIITY